MATEGIVSGERQKRHSRLVDMWIAPGIHPTNIDILGKLKSAEDRQFSKNMGVTGKAFDEDRHERSHEETHLFGIRTDIWKPSREARQRALAAIQKKRTKELRSGIKKNGHLTAEEKAELERQLSEDDTMNVVERDVDKARLVVKMFKTTGSSIRWRGTLEEISVRELHNSLGSKMPLITFAVILPGYDYLIHIQQNRRFLRIPPTFSFAYYQESTDRMWYVDLLCHWISFGIDYRVEAQGRRIGKIDGKFIALGVDSRIHIDEPALAEDSQFMDLLSLFASSIGYHRRIKSNIKRRVKAVLSGRSVHVVEDEELWLLKNPRGMVR